MYKLSINAHHLQPANKKKIKQLIRGFLNHCYIYDTSFAGATMVKDNHYNYQYSKIHIFPHVIDLGLSVFL